MTTSALRTLQLAATFPSLRQQAEADILAQRPFQPQDFAERFNATNPGTGGHHACQFICALWNPHHAKQHGKSFDILTAYGYWDSAHKHAFQAWIAQPFWP